MGKKWNRRAMALGLGAAAALLTGCFASDGLVTEEADLVFRNDSGAAVSSVQLSGASECQGASLADGSPLDFSFMAVTQYGLEALGREMDSFSSLLDAFYAQRDAGERMKQRAHDILRILTNLSDRTARKLDH